MAGCVAAAASLFVHSVSAAECALPIWGVSRLTVTRIAESPDRTDLDTCLRAVTKCADPVPAGAGLQANFQPNFQLNAV